MTEAVVRAEQLEAEAAERQAQMDKLQDHLIAALERAQQAESELDDRGTQFREDLPQQLAAVLARAEEAAAAAQQAAATAQQAAATADFT